MTTKYERSRGRSVTIAALVLETFQVVFLLILGDAIAQGAIGIRGALLRHFSWRMGADFSQTLYQWFGFLFPSGVSQNPLMVENQALIVDSFSWIAICLVPVLVLQYLLVGVEILSSYRVENRSFTFGVVFFPLGHLLRVIFVFVLCVPLIVVKLLVYFSSVVLSFLFILTRTDKYLGTARLVDSMERVLEPLELGVNHIFNFLYFNKIQPSGNAFSVLFNGNLTLWCINH